MSQHPSRVARRTRAALLAAAGTLAVSGTALAAIPQADSTFTGKTSQGKTCSPGDDTQCEATLGTESNPRVVGGFAINWRARCNGGQTFRGSRTRGEKLRVSRNGKIRANDSFTTDITGGGTARTKAKIAGEFVTRTRFHGTWRAVTDITLGSGQELRCNSRTVRYKLKAQ